MGNLSGFVKRLRDIMRNDAGINGDAQRIEQIAWMLFLKVYDAKEKDWEWNDDGYVSIIPENCRWANWAADDRSGSAMTGDRLLDFVNNTLFPTLKKLPVTASTPIRKAIVQTTFADANNYMKDGVLLRQVVNVVDDLDLSDYEESHAFGEIYETILKELQSAGSAGEFYTPRAVTDFMAKMIEPKIGETMADFACGTGGFITSWLKELERRPRGLRQLHLRHREEAVPLHALHHEHAPARPGRPAGVPRQLPPARRPGLHRERPVRRRPHESPLRRQ